MSTPFPVFETAAELLYLLKEYDVDDVFGFKDELERSECLQWLFFWHGGVRALYLCPMIEKKESMLTVS
jgi:glutathione S-transferase